MRRSLPQLPPAKWGYSALHDRALDHCIAAFGRCPLGCAKDGAPNCYDNVVEARCEPGRRALASEKAKAAP